jgi:erythromycin esterase
MFMGLLLLHGMPASAHAQERELKIADLGARAVPVRSVSPTDEDFSDLAPIAAAIGGARIVQLGETTHGDGAAFAAKVRLVKFLHQHHGFDVLLWESGMYDVRLVDDSLRAGVDPAAAARLGIFGNWSESAEVLPLFEYARASHQGDRPLAMAGVDMQFSGRGVGDDLRTLERDLLRFVSEFESTRDSACALARGVIEGFGRMYAVAIARTEFQRSLREAGVTDAVPDSLRAWRQTRQASFAPTAHDLERFLAATEGLMQILRQRQSALEGTREELEVEFVGRVVGNLRDYGLNWYAYSAVGLGGDSPEYNATEIRRDARMADNLRWLAERIYPGRKLIVWAHNGHILNAHYRPDFTGPTPEPVEGGLKRMGAYVAETFGRDVYTIAFIAFGGEYGSARSLTRRPIINMPADGIEALLHELGHSHAFLDFRRLPPEHWLRRSAVMATVNYTPETADDWTRIFDGVFFIDRMTAARPIQEH